MVRVASSLTFLLEIPLIVRDFDVHNVRWVEGNVGVAANFFYEFALDDSNIVDNSAIAKRNVDNLVTHTSLSLLQEKLAPSFWQTRFRHLTRSERTFSAFFYGVSPSNSLAFQAAARVRAKQGARSKEQGARSKEQGARSKEQGTAETGAQ